MLLLVALPDLYSLGLICGVSLLLIWLYDVVAVLIGVIIVLYVVLVIVSIVGVVFPLLVIGGANLNLALSIVEDCFGIAILSLIPAV